LTKTPLMRLFHRIERFLLMNKKIILSVVLCLLVLGGSIGFLNLSAQDADTRMMDTIETSAGDTVDTAPAPTTDTEKTEPNNNDKASSDSLVSEKHGVLIMGADDAPVTIMEFSSLSCPHCATFHKDTLPLLKTDYIDTGKVKFVFNDFPLNEPAMAGSLLLKCIPLEERYNFMELLFEQQGNWAFDANYMQKLKQYAALLGVSSEDADACMNDKDKQRLVLVNMSAAAKKFNIQSTPSFIITPGEDMMMGAQAYGEFSSKIEAILKEEESK